MSELSYALQLYTVRDHMEKDGAATLAKVREVGYEAVELAGLGGMDAAGFRGCLDAEGLRAISGHWGYEAFMADIDRVIDETKTLGAQYAVVPWLGEAICPDKAAWITAARKMDEFGARLREEGLSLCYHNHAEEFKKYDGQSVFDLIFANSAPENLAMELDTCWASVGGTDPVGLIRQYEGRGPLLHLKDYRPGEPPVLTELGRGCMDWEGVISAGKAAGARCYIVEQDECEGDSLDSARISAAFMAGFGL